MKEKLGKEDRYMIRLCKRKRGVEEGDSNEFELGGQRD